VKQSKILIIDDEQGFIRPLKDALEFEGHEVLTASTGEEALETLKSHKVDFVTVDIMMPPGDSLEKEIHSHETGILLCEEIRDNYPNLDVFCISVVNDKEVIRYIQSLGVRFLRKGETPLRKILDMIASSLTGVAYSTEDPRRKHRRKSIE
jgi:CheY-like chemotaxis protein